MFDFEPGHDQFLRTQAVATTILRFFSDAAFDFGGDVRASHRDRGEGLAQRRAQSALYCNTQRLRFPNQPTTINLHQFIQPNAAGIVQLSFALIGQQIAQLCLFGITHCHIAQRQYLFIRQTLHRQISDTSIHQFTQYRARITPGARRDLVDETRSCLGNLNRDHFAHETPLAAVCFYSNTADL
jgi:hypothetical protein